MKTYFLFCILAAFLILPLVEAVDPPYSRPYNQTGIETFSSCSNWTSNKCVNGEFNVASGDINWYPFNYSLQDAIATNQPRCEFFDLNVSSCPNPGFLWSYTHCSSATSCTDDVFGVRYDGSNIYLRNMQDSSQQIITGYQPDGVVHSVKSCYDPSGRVNVTIDGGTTFTIIVSGDPAKRALFFGWGNYQPSTQACEIRGDNWRSANSSVYIDLFATLNITDYNLTSDGGLGCTTWTSNPSGTCTTADTTPTIKITMSSASSCRISKLNHNYTTMLSSQECSGSGSTSLTCTLIGTDEILTENSQLYIGCKTTSGIEGTNSTGGALRISIQTTDLEAISDGALESAALHILGSGYTVYNDQRVYVRNAANQQATGVFDKVIKWMNKVWAFNVIHGNETNQSLFNISPVFYTLELRNTTSLAVNNTVKQLLNATK